MVKRTERQATDWEKTFANYDLTKDFHPKYIKNSQNSTIRNLNKVCSLVNHNVLMLIS